MKTPAINTKFINTLPVLLSSSVCAWFVWHFAKEQYFAALILGVIAGGLVDLDNGLTGKAKNVMYAVAAFAVSSLSVSLAFNHPVALAVTFTAIAFVFTMLGAAGTRFRTVSFGTLAVAIYTTLSHDPHAPFYQSTVLIIIGTLLYTLFTLLAHILFPHRPVQEAAANAYDALADYLDCKADFFDPDEIGELERQQIRLAMANTRVTNTFNLCRNALFYRMRGQHRHPRTVRMLRYYFAAQDIHERISSSHMHYETFTPQMAHTDLIYRIQRLIRFQAASCREFAAALRQDTAYTYPPRLARATQGAAASLDYYAAHDNGSGASPYSVQRLLDNLSGISQKLAQLGDAGTQDLSAADEKNRIQALDNHSFKTAWHILKGQFTLQSSVFRHSVRMAVIACVCCILVQIIAAGNLNPTDLSLGYWILLTAVFVCQPNYSATKSRLLHRIGGTLAGVFVGSILPVFALTLVDKLVIAVVFVSLFFFSRTNKYSYSIFFITIQAMMGFSIMGFDVAGFFVPRVIDTVLGALVAGTAVYFLWPDWKYVSLEKNGGEAITSDGGYLAAVLHELEHGITEDVAYRAARRTSHDKAAALSSVLSDMSGEPEKHGTRLDDGFKLLKINYSLISYISALGAYRDKIQTQTPEEQTFLHTFYPAARALAEILQNMPTWDETAFQAACSHARTLLSALTPLAQTENGSTQNQVLHRQLAMIAELLPECRETLNRLQNSKPLPQPKAA